MTLLLLADSVEEAERGRETKARTRARNFMWVLLGRNQDSTYQAGHNESVKKKRSPGDGPGDGELKLVVGAESEDPKLEFISAGLYDSIFRPRLNKQVLREDVLILRAHSIGG